VSVRELKRIPSFGLDRRIHCLKSDDYVTADDEFIIDKARERILYESEILFEGAELEF
jgi:hypothetical protein